MQENLKDYALLLIWLGAILLGMQPLLRYEKTAATTSIRAIDTWPQNCRLPRKSEKTLLVFVHPKCPCTKAGINELSRLSNKVRLDGFICAVKPDDAPADWLDSNFSSSCSRIKGMQLICDQAGRLSREFAASTSGETFLFDGTGKLKFHGGINIARGHEGPNDGLSNLKLLLEGNIGSGSYPVYGCALLNTSESALR